MFKSKQIRWILLEMTHAIPDQILRFVGFKDYETIQRAILKN